MPPVVGFALNFLCVMAVLPAGDVPVVASVRTVAEVRALTSEQTQLRPAVTLRGVVTYCRHAATSDFTVQDATGGVWLPESPLPPGCLPSPRSRCRDRNRR